MPIKSNQDDSEYQYPKCYTEMKSFCLCVKKIDQHIQSFHLFSFPSHRNIDNKECLEKYNLWKQCVDTQY